MDTKDLKNKTTGSGTDTSQKTYAPEKNSAETDNVKEAAAAKSASSAAENSKMKNEGNASQNSKKMEKVLETAKDGPLYKFFTDMLKDMYFAEKHILEALPKMQEGATTEELQDAFEDHYLMTQKQVSRLEKVFKLLGEKAEGKKCEAIIGIVKEGESSMKETEEGTMTRDAALIIAAQKVEHYEIASYGGLCALAETMGFYDASDILHITLEEETKTDNDLTHIAESYINFCASEDDTLDGYSEDSYEQDYEEQYYEGRGRNGGDYRYENYR